MQFALAFLISFSYTAILLFLNLGVFHSIEFYSLYVFILTRKATISWVVYLMVWCNLSET